MIVNQSYAQRSTATLEGGSFRLNVATEQSRPPVRLNATIRDGLAYARLMKTLYAVVCGDQRTPKKDRTAYFEWVQQRYLDELGEERSKLLAKMPGWMQRRDELKERIKAVNKQIGELTGQANSTEYYAAKRKYFEFLYKYDRDAWIVLDPVVSVHPDCVIFEAFSKDESSYGRVTVPMYRLELRDAVDYGTTNIDFSPDLAREISRIRSYRSTDLQVGADKVVVSTSAGAAVEKKIDLPPTWVRGFLQVQSAATLPGLDLKLSAATLADVLTVIKRNREDRGPRSLRFVLKPGQKPVIMVEPWGVAITEHNHLFEGAEAHEIRIWGRRRLLVLDQLLAYADEVQVRLMGTGLPSYWSVFLGDTRFDMGLSGWTQNDWARAAQFDLLASSARPTTSQLVIMEKHLKEKLFLTTEEAANATFNILSREQATAALQQLCREGRAMYDHVTQTYRWRQLFPFMPEPEVTAEDPRLAAARRIIEKKGVRWSAAPLKNPPPLNQKAASTRREFEFRDNKSSKFWAITLEGSSHTVQFGRIGTQGQTQTKEFDTPKEARTSYEKLIKEKTGKGYTEVTKAAPVAVSSAVVPASGEGKTRYQADVQSEKTFAVLLDLDSDGRVVYAQCSCSAYRRDKLRKGPCAHILATAVTAAQQLTSQEVATHA